ncbi:MAG: hypothetical protein GY703_05035 [Gammaproteobacteria bacterium]|nr:hypothetical protein [Gammaproteobacteria bacterium]
MLPLGNICNLLIFLTNFNVAYRLGRRELVAWLIDDAVALSEIVPFLEHSGNGLGEEFDAIHGSNVEPLTRITDGGEWVELLKSGSAYHGPGDMHVVEWGRNQIAIAGMPVRVGDGGSSLDAYLSLLVNLWTVGGKVAWHDVYAHRAHRKTPLPTYPFGGKQHWFQPRPGRTEIPTDRSSLESLSEIELIELFDRLKAS